MAHKEYKRPDVAIMQRIIQDNSGFAVEYALRLAWNLGLSRDEIHNLKWRDISFSEKIIYLPNREVPMEEEDALRLEARSKQIRSKTSEYVMFSDRDGTHMAAEYISTIVRKALEQGGIQGITMTDLRQDYVIRMLEKHDWRYAARISGISLTTLYACYSEYIVKGRKSQETESPEETEFKLWKIIRTEGTSAEGLAIWMAWKLGMTIQEIAELTWEQVDLKKGFIRIGGRNLKVGSEFLKKLQTVKAERSPDSDPHVILSPRAHKGFDIARLSRVLRSALIRGGVDVTLQDALKEGRQESRDYPILEIISNKGSATRKELMQALSLSYMPVYRRVESLLARGELVCVGQKLYLPGTVVPPEEHYDVIRVYLEKMGGALRGDIADLLHVDGNQCGVILRDLVEEGKLKLEGKVYSLPPKDAKL